MSEFIILGFFIFCCGLIAGYFIGSYTRIPTFLEIDQKSNNSFISTKNNILPPRPHVFSPEIEKKIDETLKLGEELREYMKRINK